MSENDVSELVIPDDLVEMCRLYQFCDPESQDLFPPEVVVRAVTSDSPEAAEALFLQEWLENRQMLWDRAGAILEALEGNLEGDVPGWILEPWALALRSRWGSGLSKGIVEAQKWIDEKST